MNKRKQKQVIMLALTVGITILTWSTAVGSAATTVSFDPEEVTVQLGQTFYLDIAVSNITEIYAFQFDVKWNRKYLELVSVREGEKLKEGDALTYWIEPLLDEGNTYNTARNAAASRLGMDHGVNGSGVLARIFFRALNETQGTDVDLMHIMLVDRNSEVTDQGSGGDCTITIDAEVPLYEQPPIPTGTPTEPDFTTDGCDLVNGWYWLHDNAYAATATWKLCNLAPGTDVHLAFDLLVTNQANGGSGYSTPVQVTCESPDGGSPQTVELYLQNPLSEQDPNDSQGYGYSTTAHLPVSGAYIGASGQLNVTLCRFAPHTEHVAVCREALSVVQPLTTTAYTTYGTTDEEITWLDPGFANWSFSGLNPYAETTVLFSMWVTDHITSVQPHITLNPATTRMDVSHVILYPLLSGEDMVYGSYRLAYDQVESDGTIKVHLERGSNPPRIGVSRESVQVIQRAADGSSLATGQESVSQPNWLED